MDKLNTLLWEKVKFMETLPAEKNEGYIFKIDGTPVADYSGMNYMGWMQPVYPGDIRYSKFLESSEKYDEEYDPVLACCTCGCSECDSIRAYVTINETTVNWKIFNANVSFERNENMEERFLGEYNFDCQQYENVICKLMKEVGKNLK